MPGYLAIANNIWCYYIKTNGLRTAVFWCKKKSFRALDVGDPFYFLGRRLPSGERILSGKACFDSFSTMYVADAWDKYGEFLGYPDMNSFKEAVRTIYKDDDCQLGCIVLIRPVFASSDIKISECGIAFSPYTVSGRIITEEECARADARISKHG